MNVFRFSQDGTQLAIAYVDGTLELRTLPATPPDGPRCEGWVTDPACVWNTRTINETVAHETPMVAIQPQPDAPQPKSRWFRFTWPKLLVLTLLLAASGIGLAVWSVGLPLSWTADYDKERYRQIRDAIAADPKHFRGKYFDDVIKALGLDDVPWDDSCAFNARRPWSASTIFAALRSTSHWKLCLPGITPAKNYRAVTPNGEYPPIIGVLAASHISRVLKSTASTIAKSG